MQCLIGTGVPAISQSHANAKTQEGRSQLCRCENYRPISNLTMICKVVERLVCHQLISFLKKHKLIPSLQSPYRRFHSTETAFSRSFLMHTATDRGEVIVMACSTCQLHFTPSTMTFYSKTFKVCSKFSMLFYHGLDLSSVKEDRQSAVQNSNPAR